MAQDQQDIVVIDEVQHMPELLNEGHRLTETHTIKFLLTGFSSLPNLLGINQRSPITSPF